MQRLLAFIEQNLHFILFLLLQAICGLLLFRLNPYQRAYFSNTFSTVTAQVNGASSTFFNYFTLRQGNEGLQSMVADSNSHFNATHQLNLFSDTFLIRDSVQEPMYTVIPAKVMYSSVNRADNVMVINQGRRHGVKKGSAVLSPNGVAGIVLAVGERFSTVMSVLHSDFKIIPRINGVEFFTDVKWDHTRPYVLRIEKINKLENIHVGDEVTTGNSSLIFPPDLPIGTVSRLETIENSQYFNVELKSATDFRTLHYVFVINNNFLEEMEVLMPDE